MNGRKKLFITTSDGVKRDLFPIPSGEHKKQGSEFEFAGSAEADVILRTLQELKLLLVVLVVVEIIRLIRK